MRRLVVAGLIAAGALPPGVALARATVCNKYSAAIHAAIGTVINGDTETQGWWAVAPGTCMVVDAGPLASPFYVMARTDPDAKGELSSWGTGTALAVSLAPFHDFHAQMLAKGGDALQFDEVTKGDVKDLPNVTWTVEDAQDVSVAYDDTP